MDNDNARPTQDDHAQTEAALADAKAKAAETRDPAAERAERDKLSGGAQAGSGDAAASQAALDATKGAPGEKPPSADDLNAEAGARAADPAGLPKGGQDAPAFQEPKVLGSDGPSPDALTIERHRPRVERERPSAITAPMGPAPALAVSPWFAHNTDDSIDVDTGVASLPVTVVHNDQAKAPAEYTDKPTSERHAETAGRISNWLKDTKYFLSTIEHTITGEAGEIIDYLKKRL